MTFEYLKLTLQVYGILHEEQIHRRGLYMYENIWYYLPKIGGFLINFSVFLIQFI
jgi:hypothetical protein